MSVTLDTARLRLRPFRPDDAAEVARLACRAEIAATTLAIPHPYTLADAEAWIAGQPGAAASGSAFLFAITDRSGVLLGTIGLHVVPIHRRAELGYWIGVEHWGRGYATEAGRAVLDFGFGPLALNRIEAHAFPENPASSRVLEKLGFRFEGLLRHHVVKGGVPRDGRFYAVIRSDPR